MNKIIFYQLTKFLLLASNLPNVSTFDQSSFSQPQASTPSMYSPHFPFESPFFNIPPPIQSPSKSVGSSGSGSGGGSGRGSGDKRSYVQSEMDALEREQEQIDQRASEVEKQLRTLMDSGE